MDARFKSSRTSENEMKAEALRQARVGLLTKDQYASTTVEKKVKPKKKKQPKKVMSFEGKIFHLSQICRRRRGRRVGID